MSMDRVLVLIGDPTRSVVTDEVAIVAQESLRRAVARVSAPVWLAKGTACELTFTADDEAALHAAVEAVRAALSQQPIDVCVVEAAGRRRALLMADMESTIIQQEMLDELADAVGLRDRIAEITRRAMNGELDFRTALDERLRCLAGLPVSVLDEMQARLTYMAGARTLVATMRAHGARCVLVSGGFKTFTRRVAQELGFHEDYGNELDIADGRLTGRPIEPVLDKDAKLHRLVQSCAALGVDRTAVIAVGDGANDLPMLLAAGLGVAFRAKPTVAAAAPVSIRHGDLTALLYLQGFSAETFAADSVAG